MLRHPTYAKVLVQVAGARETVELIDICERIAEAVTDETGCRDNNLVIGINKKILWSIDLINVENDESVVTERRIRRSIR